MQSPHCCLKGRAAILNCVFERGMAPKTLFPTTADILCRHPTNGDTDNIVLLLKKHDCTVSGEFLVLDHS